MSDMQNQPTQITRKVKKFGAGSAHVVVPANWLNQEVELKITNSGPVVKEITWENIEELIQEKLKHVDLKKIKSMIEEEIEAAKRGY